VGASVPPSADLSVDAVPTPAPVPEVTVSPKPGAESAPAPEAPAPTEEVSPYAPEYALGPSTVELEDPAYHGYGVTPTVNADEGGSDGFGGGGNDTPEEGAGEGEEEGGGPVKSFLEHLEDLRWMLIKVASTLFLSMLVCMIAGNKLVAFLTWPLRNAQKLTATVQPHAAVYLGTNVVGRVQPHELLPWTGRTNLVYSLRIEPVTVGTNVLLGVTLGTNDVPEPIPDAVTLKTYGPIAGFMVALKLALYGGLVISAPFLIFFIGQFVLPAMKVKEKKWLYKVAGFGAVLFLAGIAFCYFIIVQVALMASVQFAQWMGFGADEWRAEEYISFVTTFMLGMGLSFQLPLVILTFVKIGLLDYEKLTRFRAYWIVIDLCISAVVTPSGDPLTMVLMAVPLAMLYELSVGITWWWEYSDRRRAKAAGEIET
jgi:sec-independent protein translocase protein TatC